MATYKKVSKKEIQNNLNTLFVGITEFLKKYDSLDFSFQGYNPEITYSVMRSKCNTDEELNKDVTGMLLWFANRGSNVDENKIADKTDVDTANAMRPLFDKYDVLSTLEGNKDGSKAITLQRVVSAFPQVAGFIIYKSGGNNLMENNVVGLPDYLAFSAGGSLIPRDRTDLMDLWEEWAYNFDEAVRNVSKSANKDNGGNLANYVSAVLNSKYVDEVDKSRYLEAMEAISSADKKRKPDTTGSSSTGTNSNSGTRRQQQSAPNRGTSTRGRGQGQNRSRNNFS